jgi:hypothetical protein
MDDNDTVTNWIPTPGARATWRSTYYPNLRPIPGHIVTDFTAGLVLQIDWDALRFHGRDADVRRFLESQGIDVDHDDSNLLIHEDGIVVEPN